MQTSISEHKRQDREVRIAEGILRQCVHCGFCNATCPTYPLLGSELEGPRGRIYLIKSVLEERIPWSAQVVKHLDNCLSCFSCETTCPSGVRYSHLIDPARALIEQEYTRPLLDRLRRRMLSWLLPSVGRFRFAMRLGTWVRPFAAWIPGPLGANLKLVPRRLPPTAKIAVPGTIRAVGQRRARVTLLTGCAQQVLGGHINDATVRVLTRLGCDVELDPEAGCCGALVYHLGDRKAGLPLIRKAVDVWHRQIEAGLDWIVINTSGCGTVVKDYGHILADEPEYRERAAAVSARTKDFSELVALLGLPADLAAPQRGMRVAYHDACSLQHAQRVRAAPRQLLATAGFEVVDIPDGHLCYGSAGTYNLLQPQLAQTLGRAKGEAIQQTRPEAVAAGNIGCLEQMGHYAGVPMVHTAELLDWALGGPRPAALGRKR
jgi:glycolate oxidase iron-sulfur subunit